MASVFSAADTRSTVIAAGCNYCASVYRDSSAIAAVAAADTRSTVTAAGCNYCASVYRDSSAIAAVP